MQYNIYSAPHELTSPKIAVAFQAATGFNVFTDSIERSGGWIGFPSPTNINTYNFAVNNGEPYIYCDHAYFHRHKYYRVTKNEKFAIGVQSSDGKRFKKLGVPVKEWRQGNNIIICPQSDAFFKRNGIDPAHWLVKMQYKIRKTTDRPIKIHRKLDQRPLSDMLKDAWMVVCHSSNSALEAILSGVPAITTAECHASHMSSSFDDIEKPFYPEDRLQWAQYLADNQFTLDEIKKGYCNDLL